MAQEMAAGRTIKRKDLLAARGLEGPRVSLEFEFDDLVKAREQAQQRGVGVETYIRELVHEAITRNAAA
jgi:predicted DNA binding CopG/RHH family protein